MENAINQRIKMVLDFYSMSETQLAKTLVDRCRMLNELQIHNSTLYPRYLELLYR